MGQGSVRSIFVAWLHSPEHRANMLGRATQPQRPVIEMVLARAVIALCRPADRQMKRGARVRDDLNSHKQPVLPA